MMKGLLIYPEGLTVAIDFPEDDKLAFYYERLGCDYVDIVSPHGIEQVAKEQGLQSIVGKFCLVVDDESLLKPSPRINPIASLMYGMDIHGQPLCGKVLVAKNLYTDDGLETVGMDEKDMAMLRACVNALIAAHNEKVEEKNNGRH